MQGREDVNDVLSLSMLSQLPGSWVYEARGRAGYVLSSRVLFSEMVEVSRTGTKLATSRRVHCRKWHLVDFLIGNRGSAASTAAHQQQQHLTAACHHTARCYVITFVLSTTAQT